MNAAQCYSDNQRQTASPRRLMLLLFEAARRHMRAGAAAIEKGDSVAATNSLTKASDIVTHLRVSLDSSLAPRLCEQLADVYRFVCWKLATAGMNRSVQDVRDAEKVFAPIAEAFGAAVASLPAE